MNTKSHTDSIAELAKALAAAQGQFPSIPKDKNVSVKMRSGGSYKFAYADIDSITKAIKKPLSDNNLSIVHQVYEGQLVTKLLHGSGEFIQSEMPLPQHSTNYQEYGSALTYLKRYALTALLGLSTEQDDDANIVDGNQMTVEPDKPWYNAFNADKTRMLASVKAGKAPEQILEQIEAKYKVSRKTRDEILNLSVMEGEPHGQP